MCVCVCVCVCVCDFVVVAVRFWGVGVGVRGVNLFCLLLFSTPAASVPFFKFDINIIIFFFFI